MLFKVISLCVSFFCLFFFGGGGAFILNFVSVFYILDVVVGHEMIIANLTIYASLAIYHFISKVRS